MLRFIVHKGFYFRRLLKKPLLRKNLIQMSFLNCKVMISVRNRCNNSVSWIKYALKKSLHYRMFTWSNLISLEIDKKNCLLQRGKSFFKFYAFAFGYFNKNNSWEQPGNSRISRKKDERGCFILFPTRNGLLITRKELFEDYLLSKRHTGSMKRTPWKK